VMLCVSEEEEEVRCARTRTSGVKELSGALLVLRLRGRPSACSGRASARQAVCPRAAIHRQQPSSRASSMAVDRINALDAAAAMPARSRQATCVSANPTPKALPTRRATHQSHHTHSPALSPLRPLRPVTAAANRGRCCRSANGGKPTESPLLPSGRTRSG
jgi:hypothetical protein